MKVGLIGLGYWGPNLLRNLLENKLFNVNVVTWKKFDFKGIFETLNFKGNLSESDISFLSKK